MNIICALLLIFLSTVAFSGEIIIDNKDSSNTVVTGAWKISGATGPWADDSVYSNAPGDSFTFQAEVNGETEVYVWWTYFDNRNTGVEILIFNGQDFLRSVTVNQKENSAQWNSIGRYNFSGIARVQIVSNSGQTTCADAVRFVTAEQKNYYVGQKLKFVWEQQIKISIESCSADCTDCQAVRYVMMPLSGNYQSGALKIVTDWPSITIEDGCGGPKNYTGKWLYQIADSKGYTVTSGETTLAEFSWIPTQAGEYVARVRVQIAQKLSEWATLQFSVSEERVLDADVMEQEAPKTLKISE